MLKDSSNLSKKEKQQEYGRKRYENLPEHEKQRLVEYRKNIRKYGKITLLHKQKVTDFFGQQPYVRFLLDNYMQLLLEIFSFVRYKNNFRNFCFRKYKNRYFVKYSKISILRKYKKSFYKVGSEFLF